MIFVRDIRLPLSAPQGQAVESALKTLRLSRRLVEGAEISKISVDARHGSPRLVYTVAVTLKDKGAETAFAGSAPCVAVIRQKPLELLRGT